jgi:hypothetical protein
MSRTKYTDEFEAFWAAYPGQRRIDKADAFKRWRSALSSGVGVGDVMVGLLAWKRSEEWVKNDGQYVCAPEVWLNKRRWEGAPAPAKGLSLSSDLAADRPYPSGLEGKPWLAVWLEKRGTQPEPLTVMNLASALNVDAYRAMEIYEQDGLAAAGDWVWDSRKTG